MQDEEVKRRIKRDLWEVRSELTSLSFLFRNLQEAEGGADLYGIGVILERHSAQIRGLEDLLDEYWK